MDFAYDATTEQLRTRLLEFMEAHVYPAEPVFAEQVEGGEPWTTPAVVEDLKARARTLGLWNLFLPDRRFGAGLTNLQYAPLAEITGRSPSIAPEALNCSAPDTGNMEVLAMFGTSEQQTRWLRPLLDGRIRSAFCMTEPDVASSDARNITTRIARDGGEYVVDGHKWWISGAMNPRAEVFLVVGQTDPDAEPHRRQSVLLVPRDAPGVEVRRSTQVFGFTDSAGGGHAELIFSGVRVPAGNLVAGAGDGFAIAQARLGPGRTHHCMRMVGMAERALELACRRTLGRTTFGQPLAEQGVVREWVAEARVRIEQARLLVLKTAWLMDTVGNKAAHTEIQAIKITVPRMAEWVLDRAIQIHGAAGVSQDFPLARLWAHARTLRIADGPDEVHLRSLGRRELLRVEQQECRGEQRYRPAQRPQGGLEGR